jgi:hypothetical protein
MNAMLNWVCKYKGALYVSGSYAAAAVLLYVLGALDGGDGPLGAWYWVYFSAWPLSRLFNFAVNVLGTILPDSIFGFLYSASPIIAGTLWYYLIARGILALRAKLRASKRPGETARPAP